MTELDLANIRNNVKKYIINKFNKKSDDLISKLDSDDSISKLASAVEEALYESAMSRTSLHEINIYKYQIFKQRYNYGLEFFILNLKHFKEKLKKKEITVTDIFNKNPIDIFPEKWETSLIKKKEEEKFFYETHLVSNSKTTTCFKCKTINTFVQGKQTRSSDEPETMFYLCLTCGNTWKK